MVEEIITKDKFEKLFREQYPKLCAFANTFLKDIQASEDVVHDILFKLWENRETIQIDISIEAYLYRAVRNKSLNVIRHIEVKEQYKSYNEEAINDASQHEVDTMESSELDLKIRESIDSLPEKRKEIFQLSRFEGLRYAEISKKLNISVKTVENQMSSALKYLRSELTGFFTILILFFLKNF
ncbi:RNA polymerase sigma-70 factor [Flammeovirga sp. EKP202]|uniref:RNA polymerase sigma-70 factor n=1 Tax=Flammeovirga sp. EKP202 TaxID=2770592 RepID=UPI00165FF00C|nr:RNA polymerase sigma-70 factor [Flammeovirga sp. EKP202]MBD0401058.1 RNA polymerase sigma-70 factor [Flammeovirga sp. EKP202]